MVDVISDTLRGVSRFPRAYRQQLAVEDAANVDRAVGDVSDQPASTRRYFADATDNLRLRGVPAIGPGVSGAIRGTRPGDSLWR